VGGAGERSEIGTWIDRSPLEAHFVVKVGASGISALTNRSNHCTTFELLALVHTHALEVGVARLVPISVFDNDEAAEISRTTGKSHPTVGG